MKTKSILVILISLVIISACAPDAVTSSPQPTLTTIPTFTPTHIPTETNTPTVTPLPFSYNSKQVLLHYYNIGSHGLFDMAVEPNGSRLIIYSDGQIVIPGETNETKNLSPDEMDELFTKLKSLGFYDIETDEQGYATKNLYTPDNPFEKITDAPSYCILTTTQGKIRDICAYEPYRQYLIPAMQQTLKFLDDYHPKEMKPYIPDRILLYVEDPETSQSIYVDPLTPVITWPIDLPPLKPNLDGYKVTYVQGPMALKIASYLNSFQDLVLFQQNGINYFVAMSVLLPHEEVDFSAVQW